MEFHPVSNLFPMMSGEEFEALLSDIKANGLQEAIWTHEDKIIDGRNRYKACMQAGVAPSFRVWDGKGSLVQLVVSLNLKRRHLSSSQKAMVGADMLPILEAEAKERQGKRNDLTSVKDFAEVPSPVVRSASVAASSVGTNAHYVSDAKNLTAKAPDLATKVREGAITLPEAKTLVHLTEEKRAEVSAWFKMANASWFSPKGVHEVGTRSVG